MIITNNFNLSPTVVDAIKAYVEEYDLVKAPDNVLSVTQLIDAPRPKILVDRHRDKIAKDATEFTWLFIGSAAHNTVERLAAKGNPNAERLSEERWFYDLVKQRLYTVDGNVKFWETENYDPNSYYVSGKSDCYDGVDGVVEDHKVTSVWSIVYSDGGSKPEWERQLNCYAFAFRLLGFPVNALKINTFYRDFQKSKAGNTNYPPASQQCIKVPLWTQEATEEYLVARSRVHFNACKLADEELPFCTPEERWAKPTTYAVNKEGRKTAVRVFNDEADATALALELGRGHSVEQRPGRNTRCEDYCDAKQFCPFGKNL